MTSVFTQVVAGFTTKRASKSSTQLHAQANQAASRSSNAYPLQYTRREVSNWCATVALTAASAFAEMPAEAVQGLTAGRIPGLSTEPDADGFYTYKRPEGKSGGHGVGWSEIPQYSFKIPDGWEEEPVSIADLGGTEIDLRFQNLAQGKMFVVVAPVLRFMDVGFNADVRIEEIGSPELLITGFAPELFGKPLEEDEILSCNTVKKGNLTYYEWELKPHRLVTATAVKNRVFILGTDANGRQWRKGADALKAMQGSFQVPNTS